MPYEQEMNRYHQTTRFCAWFPVRQQFLAALLLGFFACSQTRAQDGVSVASAPIRLHPANPHYFEWHDRPTLLITSGEHYGALLNLAFDYRAYLKTLAADGLNHTRVFSGVYREIPGSFGITDNPLAPSKGNFIAPWARSDQPGESDGQNKFDLSKFESAYFERLRDLMTHARTQGIVVELTLFCPMYDDQLWSVCPMNGRNNIQGIGMVGREEVYTLRHPELLEVQRAFVKRIVTELKDFDNLYYEVCNEPYFGGVTQEWQNNIAQLIYDTETSFPHRHLISMNIANKTATVKSPHPAISILNFHYCVPPVAVADNYGLNLLIGENETGFRGKSDVLYRTEAWDFMIAGGGLFNNLDYSFTPGHPTGDFLEYQSPGGGSPTLRRQLKVLKEFMERFEFVKMRPQTNGLQRPPEGLECRILSEIGRQYAIYMHVPIVNEKAAMGEYDKPTPRAQLALELPAGRYTSQWVDTKNGNKLREDRFTHPGGTWTTESPDFTTDVALGLHRID